MSTVSLVAPIALLLVMAILPDILLLWRRTLSLMPHSIRTILGIAAAAAVMLRRLLEAGRWAEAAPDPLACGGYRLYRRNGPRRAA